MEIEDMLKDLEWKKSRDTVMDLKLYLSLTGVKRVFKQAKGDPEPDVAAIKKHGIKIVQQTADFFIDAMKTDDYYWVSF